MDNYDAFSPVEGKVIDMKTLIAPIPRFSGGINKEHLILIQNKDNQGLVFKFLHINPSIDIGQEIKVGDFLGKTIRNGYFAPWSSPHIHLEIRSKEDAIRASGGKSFSLYVDRFNHEDEILEQDDVDIIPVTIESVYTEYFLARFPDYLYYKVSPYIGVKGSNRNIPCIIDGGIPMYNRGIAIFNKSFKADELTPMNLIGKKIGTLWEQREQLGLFKFDQVKFYLNNLEIRGISLFIAKFKPFIKIVPFDMKDHPYEENSIQNLSLISAP